MKISYPQNDVTLVRHRPQHLCEGKAIPVTGHEGPLGCETSRFPHLV
jgi:hypothetical protein